MTIEVESCDKCRFGIKIGLTEFKCNYYNYCIKYIRNKVSPECPFIGHKEITFKLKEYKE